jgi:hypothetical protein
MTAKLTTTDKTAAALLIAVPLIFTAGFTGLQMTFEYPDILRHPAGEVLTRFSQSGADLHSYWYAMMFASLLMIGGVIALGLRLWQRDSLLAGLSIGAGVLASLVQALGLLRWVLLVPSLAALYVAPGASELDKAMAVSLFDFANHYLGMGVGEHLGYFFTAIWTVLASALLFNTNRILAVSGVAIAIGVASGMLEPFGVPMTGAVNAISYTLWALWTLLLGITILRTRSTAALPVGQPA